MVTDNMHGKFVKVWTSRLAFTPRRRARYVIALCRRLVSVYSCPLQVGKAKQMRITQTTPYAHNSPGKTE